MHAEGLLLFKVACMFFVWQRSCVLKWNGVVCYMCVKDIVVETCDTCLRYTPPSAMKIFGLRISNFTQIRMWLHPPVYHCRFLATFSRLGLLFSQLQPRLLHWPTSICAGVTILSMSQSNTLLAKRTGTTVLVEISYVSLLLQVHQLVPGGQFLLWFPDTVLCLLHVHWLLRGSRTKGFSTNSYILAHHVHVHGINKA